MITDTTRREIYLELEKHYPLRSPERAGAEGKEEADFLAFPASPLPVGVQWKRKLRDLREQLHSQLLFLFQSLFDFSSDPARVGKAVEGALEQLEDQEKRCRQNQACDARTFALHLFRRHWHSLRDSAAPEEGGGTGASPSHLSTFPPTTLLSGMPHLEESGFFNKVPLEIAGWTQFFLLIERYHRLDALEHEKRLDRFHSWTVSSAGSGQASIQISSFDDLQIRLEQTLLRSPEKDAGTLSRELARELEGRISPEVLPSLPLQPTLYVFLRCHQFCMAETVAPSDRQRLERLFATRRMDSLLDLMRIVAQETLKEHRLPEVGVVLDELQARGFNIEHQGFRDPYEAFLAPLEETERLEACRLPFFLPLDHLSGDFETDRLLSWREFAERHTGIVHTALEDCRAFARACKRPLPQSQAVHKLIRFAVSWTLAAHCWPLSQLPENMEEQIRGLLPADVTRHLVRPRKGYEIKSKAELNRLVDRELRVQAKALRHIARTRRIQGLHDYTQFVRYWLFQRIQEKYGKTPGVQLEGAGDDGSGMEPLFPGEKLGPESFMEAARQWGLDTTDALPHGLDSTRGYLLEKAPLKAVSSKLSESFEVSENERHQILLDVLEPLVPIFHRLVVAYGRHKAQGPDIDPSARVKASLDDMGRLAVLLAPPLEMLEKEAFDYLKGCIGRWSNAMHRAQSSLYFLNVSEWEAYLAWETKRRAGGDVSRFIEEGDLDGLRQALEETARELETAPGAVTTETVASVLLKLLQPDGDALGVSEEQIREVTFLLPQMDCGACGRSSCRDFARAVLEGRAEADACIQMPPQSISSLKHTVNKLQAELAQSGDGAGAPVNYLQVMGDRRTWKASSEKETVLNVLSTRRQRARRLFLDQVKTVWDGLYPKPDIFKCPDPETLYEQMCRYLGFEAAERIGDDERRFLTEHGSARQEAEWRYFKQRQDWLVLARRQRESRPLLQSHDPAHWAENEYGRIFFLHQLKPRDRRLVLEYRLEQHQDGFSHWWNEDLLTMNLPDFSIRDWEDFSKVIKNAYWHQEASLVPAELRERLRKETASTEESFRMVDAFLGLLIDGEAKRIETGSESAQGRTLENLEQLRDLLEGLAYAPDPGAMAAFSARHPILGVQSVHLSPQDQLELEWEALWERFQNSAVFEFSPAFACSWETLLPEEQAEWRSKGLPPFTSFEWSPAGIDRRVALVKAVGMACLRRRQQEQAEVRWLEEACPELGEKGRAAVSTMDDEKRESVVQGGRPPLGSFVTFIKRELRRGGSRKTLMEKLRNVLHQRPDIRKGLQEDVLHRLVTRYCVRLEKERTGIREAETEDEHLIDFLPSHLLNFLTSNLDRELLKAPSMDRERLFHALFMLAKMEGNLDTLTALLREIRETSDVIEAAWLRFTEQRLVEGPMPKTLPGTTLGIPLLASRIEDKSRVNQGLRDGVSRREKRNIAAAVNELLTLLRYHVLLQAERTGDHQKRDRHREGAAGEDPRSAEAVEAVLRDFQEAGYDLSGIENESLHTAAEREWKRRAQLWDQKIWIFTTATARRLAAQSQELQDAERDFYKVRLDILKDEAEKSVQQQEAAARRSVALGRVKEEMYHQLSDLLEKERMATFQKWIRRIVEQLDQKRLEIHTGWARGEINRRTLFYLLRRHQKDSGEPTWRDVQSFLKAHWFEPLAELRKSGRPDRDERIRDLDARFRGVLGASLLALEEEAAARAENEVEAWIEDQLLQVYN